MDRYGDRRAADLEYANAEPIGEKLPVPEKIPVGEATEVHVDEKEEARLERLEAIKAMQEKVTALRLEQSDNDTQIANLTEQIQKASDDELPALTGERVKQLKGFQTKKEMTDARLGEYEKKLQVAEAQYRTVFGEPVAQ